MNPVTAIINTMNTRELLYVVQEGRGLETMTDVGQRYELVEAAVAELARKTADRKAVAALCGLLRHVPLPANPKDDMVPLGVRLATVALQVKVAESLRDHRCTAVTRALLYAKRDGCSRLSEAAASTLDQYPVDSLMELAEEVINNLRRQQAEPMSDKAEAA